MDHALLEAFLEVARRESFTAAARTLGFTQSAVSRQIAMLETEMQATLFDRLARGVRLTEEGRALLPHARAVVERWGTAREAVRSVRELTSGRLRLGAIPTANMALVPTAIAAFRKAHPDVAVTHREGLTRDLVLAVRDGATDAAVIGTASPSPAFEGVRLRRLMDDTLSVALPRGHRLASRKLLRLADLADESWIAGQPRPEDTLLAGLRGVGVGEGAGAPIEYVVLEWAAKQGFVAAGLGVTLIPSLAAAAVRPDVAVVALHPDDVTPRSVFVATPEGVSDSPALVAFLGFLERG